MTLNDLTNKMIENHNNKEKSIVYSKGLQRLNETLDKLIKKMKTNTKSETSEILNNDDAINSCIKYIIHGE